MVFRTTLRFLIPFLLSWNASAENITLNPAHPQQYTVQSGDTLWYIAGKFLQNPGQWPELWSYNNQISNPHLIYPGDTLYFSVVNGHPQLSLSKTRLTTNRASTSSTCVINEDENPRGRTEFQLDAKGKVKPCIRESRIKQAVSLLPSEAIRKYLTSPRVVSEKELNAAPYVIGFAGEHLIGGAGDKVYVRSVSQPQSLAFTIYRPGATYVSPETGQVLGYEAKYVGSALLEQEGDPATLTIDKVKGEILPGDRIMHNEDADISLNYFPRPPEHSVKGSIISVFDGIQQIGQYNVVIIDKGSADGLQPGHQLDIYRRGNLVADHYSAEKNDQVRLPDELAGNLMVFRAFEHLSYALVMKASQAIHLSDNVQTP